VRPLRGADELLAALGNPFDAIGRKTSLPER